MSSLLTFIQQLANHDPQTAFEAIYPHPKDFKHLTFFAPSACYYVAGSFGLEEEKAPKKILKKHVRIAEKVDLAFQIWNAARLNTLQEQYHQFKKEVSHFELGDAVYIKEEERVKPMRYDGIYLVKHIDASSLIIHATHNMAQEIHITPDALLHTDYTTQQRITQMVTTHLAA